MNTLNLKIITNSKQAEYIGRYVANGLEPLGFLTEPKTPGDIGYESNQTMWLKIFVKEGNDSLPCPVYSIRVSCKKGKMWK